MFCSKCNTRVQDGDYFCKNCGASLRITDGVVRQPNRLPRLYNAPKAPNAPRRGQGMRNKNPYRDSIMQIRLQLKELRMQLQELNNGIRSTRSNYFEFDSFMQRLFHDVGRMIEGAQLYGPYQQRKQLQDQIMQLERELLPLEQAQEQWRRQQQHDNDSYVMPDVL